MEQQRKILIIDDEKDMVLLAAKRIRASGYEVACLYEGEGVMQEIQRIKPDLILLDIWLPDISGLDLYKELRADPQTRNTPVVFFSADPSHESRCLEELHADGFVRKPYNPLELLRIIKKSLLKK